MTKVRKVHLKDPKFNFPKHHFDSRIRGRSERLTEEPEKVTCKRCLNAMKRVQRDNFKYTLKAEDEVQRRIHICEGSDYYMLCGLFRYKQIWVVTKEAATCEDCVRIARERDYG